MSTPESFVDAYRGDEEVRNYIDRYYSDPTTPGHNWEWYHNLLKDGSYSGSRLLQLGSGPTIAEVISFVPWYSHIVSSDLMVANRRAVTRWTQRHDSAHDWTPFFDHIVCTLEGQSKAASDARQDETRRKLAEVVHCDVHNSAPLGDKYTGTFDAVLCSCVLECACDNPADYQRALQNVSTLLRDGGHLFLETELFEESYTINGNTYPCLLLDDGQSAVTQWLRDAGFDVIKSWEDVANRLPGQTEGCLYFVAQLKSKKN